MKTFNRILIAVFCFLFSFNVSATEGMWIPSLLKAIEDDMQAMGLELTAEDIYSINNSSLKDAIVHFGGGCTAELISSEGLLLTNHHCGYSQIQSHSSLENNYLKDGFWAMNKAQELKNDGLTATLIKEILDVTDRVNKGITSGMSIEEMSKLKAQNMKKLEAESTSGDTKGSVRAYNYGNSYFLITSVTYKDVRLVGAPPSAVGKFGGDLDNWIWPRHTGDFSMFRIYADANNNPAAYSESNQPYEPKQHLKVSMNGVEEGDFTMVFGFPGRTEQYLISDQVKYVTETSNPMKIHMRDESLNIINAAMRADEKTFIQYASKQSSISNSWKKWKGQSRGLKRMDAVNQKTELENEFMKRAEKSGSDEYKMVLKNLKELSAQNETFKKARELYIEYFFYGPEIVGFASDMNGFCEAYQSAEDDKKRAELKETYTRKINNYFDDYNLEVDKEIFKALTPLYSEYLDDNLEPIIFIEARTNWADFTKSVYKKSVLTSRESALGFINKPSNGSIKKYKKSKASQLASGVYNVFYQNALPDYGKNNALIGEQMKLYVKGLSELFPENTYWSDANSTLRLTYGKAEGSEPNDGMAYKFYTTGQGILDKHATGHADYELPSRLVSLLQAKDYGDYAHSDGTLRVCFTGSNHTTGGNSGSPTLDSKGHLIGLNFDRSWESTMSDIMFDPEQCRNIMVDVKYILWFIDKYAEATHLIEEMDLVKGKEAKAEPVSIKLEDLDGENVLVIAEEMPYNKSCADEKDNTSRTNCSNTEVLKFMSRNIKYPEICKENGIEGKVFVEFVVDKNGNVKNAKILKESHPALGLEALRVVNKLPQFVPGSQKGKPVNVKLTLPVNFRLD